MINILRWLWLSITGILYVTPGVFRIPFGTAGSFYRRVSGTFGKRMLWAIKTSYTADGLEHLQSGSQYIFIGNHQSYADIFLIQSSLEDADIRTLFMVKKELFKLPLFGIVTRHMGLVPVEREETRQAMKAMLQAVQRLQDGNSLVIFAEGTRTRDGDLGEFKRGGFMLAEKSKLPIVPFVITGTMEVMSANDLKINRNRSCHISFLPPIEPETMSAKELTVAVRKVIGEKYEQQRTVKKATLGFGGNIGDTKEIIEKAVKRLEKKNILFGVKMSSFYKSKSLLNDGQADYINAVCTAGVSLSPEELIKVLRETEDKFGRDRKAGKWQSRRLDIDIIDYSSEVISAEGLQIPHPEMANRSFVLIPLKEIREDYVNPSNKKTVSEMIDALQDSLGIEKL